MNILFEFNKNNIFLAQFRTLKNAQKKALTVEKNSSIL